MEQRIVKLQIRDEFISGAGVSVGAVGSHNDVLLEMDFTNSALWVGTSRKAIFHNALGENPTTIILTADLLEEGQDDIYLVPVPGAAKDVAGECFLHVEGWAVENEVEVLRVVTQDVTFRVMPSKLYTSGESITPSEVEQLQAEIDHLRNQAVDAEKVGLDPVEGLNAENVQEAVSSLKKGLDDAVIGAGVGGYVSFKEGEEPAARTKGYLYGKILADYREVNGDGN